MSTATFELDPILAPISDDLPEGEDPKNDDSGTSPFHQAKDNRTNARNFERQALVMGEDSAEAYQHWRTVRRVSLDLLASKAKDLRVAAWLVEALMRTDGPAGLIDGLIATRGLVENFWGRLHPKPEEDEKSQDDPEGVQATVSPLAGLNGDVITSAMQQWEVTGGISKGPYKFWQHRQALEMQKATEDERQARVAQGAVSSDDFDRAVMETDASYFLGLMETLTKAREELALLSQALSERAGYYAPSFSLIDEGLENCQGTLRLVAGDKLLVAEAIAEEGAAGGDAGGSGRAAGGGSVDNALSSREDAFKALLRIADFMERLEPQSLLPAEIRKVVRRGRMKPEELYRDLIMDDSVLERLFRDVGLEVNTGG